MMPTNKEKKNIGSFKTNPTIDSPPTSIFPENKFIASGPVGRNV
jgi:hypothetical protein